MESSTLSRGNGEPRATNSTDEGTPARSEEQQTGEGHPSSCSLYGLDSINFLMADVRDGVGPYLAVFLKGAEHWNAGAISIAMAASSIAAAVCQVPAGLLVEAQSYPEPQSEPLAQPVGRESVTRVAGRE